MKLIIVSGRSGSGKSAALHQLEDMGYYCIDNIPLEWWMLEHDESFKNLHPNVAISIDCRNIESGSFNFHALLKKIQTAGYECHIVYLDSSEKALLKRFSETRRKHPLSDKNLTLLEALQLENKILQSIAIHADVNIDTSDLTIHEFKRILQNKFNIHESKGMLVTIVSFGFKKGLPSDADYVFDVRYLPNPYWQPDLRNQTGKDLEVIKFFQNEVIVDKTINSIASFLTGSIPEFLKANRSYLTIGIGCTGGIHRSVYVSQVLEKKLQKDHSHVKLVHRDLKH